MSMKWTKTQRTRYRKRKLYRLQNGRCWWCGEQMIYPDGRKYRHPPKLLATIEHLDSRLSGRRGAFGSKCERTVLACRECNHRRGAQEQQWLSHQELHARAGRWPLGTSSSIPSWHPAAGGAALRGGLGPSPGGPFAPLLDRARRNAKTRRQEIAAQ
jgi:hypothetical protein